MALVPSNILAVSDSVQISPQDLSFCLLAEYVPEDGSACLELGSYTGVIASKLEDQGCRVFAQETIESTKPFMSSITWIPATSPNWAPLIMTNELFGLIVISELGYPIFWESELESAKKMLKEGGALAVYVKSEVSKESEGLPAFLAVASTQGFVVCDMTPPFEVREFANTETYQLVILTKDD